MEREDPFIKIEEYNINNLSNKKIINSLSDKNIKGGISNKESLKLPLIINENKKTTFITGIDNIIEKKNKIVEKEEKIPGSYYIPIIMTNIKREYSHLSQILRNKKIDLTKKINFRRNKSLFKGPVFFNKNKNQENEISESNEIIYYMNEGYKFNNNSLDFPFNNYRNKMKERLFSQRKLNFHRNLQKKIFYEKFQNNSNNSIITARQIVMNKLPHINQFQRYHFQTDSNLNNEKINNYNYII